MNSIFLIIIPLVIVQLALVIFALTKISRLEEPRYLPKWVWILIIVFGNTVGPIVALIVNKDAEYSND